MRRVTYLALAMLLVAGLAACNGVRSDKKQTAAVVVPTFNADSAYAFVQTQVDFGPRVPETAPHAACADFLTNTLQRFGAQVAVQQGKMNICTGETKALKNIIGQFNADAKRRVLLCGH